MNCSICGANPQHLLRVMKKIGEITKQSFEVAYFASRSALLLVG